MLFQTPEFFFLLVLSSFFFWAFPRYRLYTLGIASAIFYGWAGTAYLIIFFVIAVLTYICSLFLSCTGRKIYILAGIIINVGNLVFFKYAVFLLRELTGISGITLIPPGSILGQLVLPVGISFYTFQLIAYLVDVYRGEISPPGFIRFWVFISFFAQLVAGPIMRGRDFLPQINRLGKFKWDFKPFKLGLFLIILGLFKKIVLADQISPLANWFFARPRYISGLQAWAGAYLFGFQIYLDFSGYSDIALGLGKIFGLKLAKNFDTPYLSSNPSEFWRRWHISLSSWIRDYIYIPLGGSRKGPRRRYMNLFLAMVICGFWHGAAWTFMLWGAFHGLVLVIYHQYKPRFNLRYFNEKTRRWISVFVTYQIVTIGWVFFRSTNISRALIYLAHMFHDFRLSDLLSNKKSILLVIFLFTLHLAENRLRRNPTIFIEKWDRVPPVYRGLIYFLIVGLILVSLPNGGQNFIYFRF